MHPQHIVLYQALLIRHAKIAFTVCVPSTIEGNFGESAVDAGLERQVTQINIVAWSSTLPSPTDSTWIQVEC